MTTLIRHQWLRWEWWGCLFMYALLLVLPLYSEYSQGASVPVYHFLIQTYLSASTSAILVMVACFPLAKSIIQEKQCRFYQLSVLRAKVNRYILGHWVANTVSCLLLVTMAYIIAIVVIGRYAPLDIVDESLQRSYEHSYLNASNLLANRSVIFYVTQWGLQVGNAMFYLGVTMVLSLLVSDVLIVGVLPMMLYSLLKVLLPLVKLPLFLNPNIVFSPLRHLQDVLPQVIHSDTAQVLYVMFYLVVVWGVSYRIMVRLFRKYLATGHQVRL